LALEVLLRTTSEESMEVGKAYLNIANYYIAAENNEKAMWALKQALSIISKLSPKDPVMGLIYWGIAKVHERRGEYTEALTHCTAGEELYLMTHSVGDLMSIKFWFMQIRLRKEMSQPDFSEEEYLAKEQMILHYYGAEEPLIEFYLFFADMYADSNLYKQAADVLSKVLIMSDDKLGGLSLTSQAILYRMIFAHRYMKDNESALKVASELIQRLRLAPEQYQDMKRAADTFFVIGRIKDSLESYNDAIENFSHALTVYNSVVGKDCTESADCHKQMGDIYSKCGQSKQALEHYQNGLRIAESKYGESSVEAGIYYSLIAEEYFFDDDYPLAVEYYIKVIELDDGNGEDLSKEMLNAIRKAYIGIGSCQVFVEDYEAAKSTYDFLFDRFGHANNLEYSDIYLKYAMTLKGCGQDQEALTHYFKAINLKIIFHGGDNKYLAPIYVKVAQIYEEHNMRDEALEYYTNGVNIFIKFVCRDHEYVMSNYYQIARLQLINEKYQEAFDAAMQAKEIYDNLGLDSTEEYATIYGYLYEAAIKLGRTEEALKYKKI
ncbi:MAG: tetratricopeptide repeat protein, partial [Rikenellaceae bacterium]